MAPDCNVTKQVKHDSGYRLYIFVDQMILGFLVFWFCLSSETSDYVVLLSACDDSPHDNDNEDEDDDDVMTMMMTLRLMMLMTIMMMMMILFCSY